MAGGMVSAEPAPSSEPAAGGRRHHTAVHQKLLGQALVLPKGYLQIVEQIVEQSRDSGQRRLSHPAARTELTYRAAVATMSAISALFEDPAVEAFLASRQK